MPPILPRYLAAAARRPAPCISTAALPHMKATATTWATCADGCCLPPACLLAASAAPVGVCRRLQAGSHNEVRKNPGIIHAVLVPVREAGAHALLHHVCVRIAQLLVCAAGKARRASATAGGQRCGRAGRRRCWRRARIAGRAQGPPPLQCRLTAGAGCRRVPYGKNCSAVQRATLAPAPAHLWTWWPRPPPPLLLAQGLRGGAAASRRRAVQACSELCWRPGRPGPPPGRCGAL